MIKRISEYPELYVAEQEGQLQKKKLKNYTNSTDIFFQENEQA